MRGTRACLTGIALSWGLLSALMGALPPLAQAMGPEPEHQCADERQASNLRERLLFQKNVLQKFKHLMLSVAHGGPAGAVASQPGRADASSEKLERQLQHREAELRKLQKKYKALRKELYEASASAKDSVTPADCGVVNRCTATAAEMQLYLSFKERGPCPDDWYFVQHLIFVRSCFCLPRRRCFTRTSPQYVESSVPFPDSLFDQRVLDSRNVRWDGMYYPSFEAVNRRDGGDCRDCFNLTMESHRWKRPFRGTIPMEEVIALKPKGALRIGLDAGGGTGSFAAHMAQHGITVVTTAMNTETISGFRGGLPYMEAIALRGLIPLHLPHVVRQPFYDGTLDIIHAVNSIKYLSFDDFEGLMFEWDRILRPGGIVWFEMFYAHEDDMPKYLAILDLFHYKKLYWNMTPKPDQAERPGAHLYLTCVLEKPVRN